MIENIKRTAYKGFCLFNDIPDYILKTRNRAVVLANLAEDNQQEGKINTKGAALILGYFQQIPTDEREDTKNKFVESMKERGFPLAI